MPGCGQFFPPSCSHASALFTGSWQRRRAYSRIPAKVKREAKRYHIPRNQIQKITSRCLASFVRPIIIIIQQKHLEI